MPVVFIKFSKVSMTTHNYNPFSKVWEVKFQYRRDFMMERITEESTKLGPAARNTSIKGHHLPKWISELCVLAQTICLKSLSNVTSAPLCIPTMIYTQNPKKIKTQDALSLTSRKSKLTTNCALYYRIKILSLWIPNLNSNLACAISHTCFLWIPK